jgi:hypothetical protein
MRPATHLFNPLFFRETHAPHNPEHHLAATLSTASGMVVAGNIFDAAMIGNAQEVAKLSLLIPSRFRPTNSAPHRCTLRPPFLLKWQSC